MGKSHRTSANILDPSRPVGRQCTSWAGTPRVTKYLGVVLFIKVKDGSMIWILFNFETFKRRVLIADKRTYRDMCSSFPFIHNLTPNKILNLFCTQLQSKLVDISVLNEQ